MNERIKELAKEAAVVYQKTLPPATHTTPLYLMDKLGKDAKDAGIEIISDGFCEKFAELIIRECSQFVEDKFDFCGDELIIAEQILKHFGVEE
jgi:hypothetical protein